MKIKVTQQDIDVGLKGDATLCPIARAVNRVLADGYHAKVFEKLIMVGPSNNPHNSSLWALLRMPAVAKHFIYDLDICGKIVHPFSFDIDIPESLLTSQEYL